MIRYRSNPRKHPSIITVDGKQYQAKYIGKGQYSKVYRVGDRVVYYTRGDCGKEVLAMYLYDRMAHLPELIRHENIITARDMWYVFSSPWYRNVKKSDGSAYLLMKRIISWYSSIYNQYHQREGIQLMQAIVINLEMNSDLPRSVIKALQEIVNVASNCGERVGFDLHKKNFGVNEYGTLIFRDPIYVRE
jgi:hypothetical protein